MNIRFIIGKILYEIIGKRMPSSFSHVNFGSRKFRQFCIRLMLGNNCGKWINVEKNVYIPKDLVIGNGSGIGANSIISNNTKIGDNVMTGPELIIYTRNHRFDRLDIPMGAQGFADVKPVIIENDVWIGARVTILPGVHVGNGAVIGAGSVVTKNVGDYEVWAGNPAKFIKSRKSMK